MTTTYIDPAGGFAAYALQARTDNTGADVDDANGEDLRALFGALTAGIVTPGDGYKVAPDSGLDLTVGSGTSALDLAVIAGEDGGQGNYLARLGDATTAVTIDAADLSNPRYDSIWLVVLDDTYDSSGLVLPRLAVTKGTPAGTPAVPDPDGTWKASLRLADVLVAAGATSIDAADITDRRTFARLNMAGGGTVPPGVIMDYASTSIPDGWLYCDGSAISRTTYAALFAVLGETWGAGDGSTTFNIPELRGRIRIGKAGATGLNVADTAGTWNHTHTGPAHTHDRGTLAVPAHSTHTHDRGTLAVPAHSTHTHDRGTLAVPAHSTHTHGRGTLAVPAHSTHTHTFADSFSTGAASSGDIGSYGSSPWQRYALEAHSHSGSVAGTTSPDGPTSHGTITGATAADGPTSHGTITGATGSDGPTSHGTITGATGSDGPTSHGTITGATGSDGTGATGAANPPVTAIVPIIKT